MRKTMMAMSVLALLGAAACQAEVEIAPGPDTCDDYLQPDYAGLQPVDFVVVNNTNETVYLDDGSCGAAGFELFEDGAPVIVPGGLCEATCEDHQAGSIECPAIDCALRMVVIAPGGRYRMSWSGFMGRMVDMPLGCYPEPALAPPNGCMMIEPAETQAYEVGLQVYPGLACDEGNENCPCQPNIDGYCTTELYGGGPSGEPLALRAAFNYPSDDPVELIVE